MSRTDRSELCRHYWVIEQTEKPEAKGVCASCGAEKVFQNVGHHRTHKGEMKEAIILAHEIKVARIKKEENE